MTRYAITGTPDISPDCTTPDTGEPAGERNGQPYWMWTNEAGTWYLSKWAENMMNPASVTWGIGPRFGISVGAEPGWQADERSETGPAGTYSPNESATGTATVAEYVPPTSDPRLRGVLKLLITHVNGTELNPSKRFELEFDS